MGNKTTSGTLFKPELVKDLFNKVKGKSTLAKLCGGDPMPFAGIDVMTFSMDGEASIVADELTVRNADDVSLYSLVSMTVECVGN